MNLSGLSVGDYFPRNGQVFRYVGTTADVRAVVAIDSRGYGGSELPQTVTAASLTIPSASLTLLPLQPSTQNLTIVEPFDGKNRVIWNIGTTYTITLPDGAVVKPGEKYEISRDQVGDWISSPVHLYSGIVVGSGTALPAPTAYATGKLWLLHDQADQTHNGWYEATGAVTAVTWTQRTTSASGSGVGIGTSLPAISASYNGPRIFILHTQATTTDEGVWELVDGSWVQRTD